MPPKINYKCAKCNKRAEDQKCHLMIECDCCGSWYHSLCQNLTKTEATLISDGEGKGIKWFCHICSSTLIIKTSTQARTTDEKLDAISQSIKELTSKVENNRNTPVPEKLYSEALKTNTETIMKCIDENTSHIKWQGQLVQQSIEHTKVESRKVNAILHGLPEKTDKSVDDQVSEFIANECSLRTSTPINSFRLGEKNASKPRPIKLKFKDEMAKWEFVKRVNYKFKNSGIFCLLDRSKEERNEEFKLRETLKKLHEIHIDKKFRVRDMKIQVETNSGEWISLKKENNAEWTIPAKA